MKKKYYKGHLIQKKWNQIFLRDQKIINAIIKFINPQKHQKIVEIGPGLGALTEHILNLTDDLVAIERDINLTTRLIAIHNTKKLKIYNQDVMTTNFFNLSNQINKKLRLVGNLPYSISSKFIIYLFKYLHVIQDMHFMFQKEVAKRLFALPNEKEYGRLSIITQYHCKVTPLLIVPATSFVPVPKIESMVIRLSPHTNPIYPKINIELLSELTKLAFRQRRKIIQNSLSTLFNKTDMIQKGIDTTLRAENLTINQYCILTNMLTKKHIFNKK